jgi:hypothetical protein
MNTAAMAFVLGLSVVTGIALMNYPLSSGGPLPGQTKLPPNQSFPGRASNNPTNPGVYQTFPYSCLVVVPERHPDENAIRPAPGVDGKIRVIEPELQFVPHDQARGSRK